MTLVVLVCVAISGVAGLWSLYRHRRLVAWNKELEAAFVTGERPDMPRHRVL